MLVNSRIVKRKYILLVTVLFSASLIGCSDSAIKRTPPAPAVSDLFLPDGHIIPEKKVEDSLPNSAPIPSIINKAALKLPRFGESSSSSYSISAVNVPVAELLYQVASDAGKQIDLYAGIKGQVTINAINQPLDKILERIAEQAGLMYVLDNNTITVKPDFPEWRNYKIDYVNINKKSKDSIDMKMSVSGSGSGGGATNQNAGSSTTVSVESEHNFWPQLENNIKLLAQLDPYSSSIPADARVPVTVGQNTVINPEAGVISVYTTASQHKAIKQYIKEISTRADRQVLIEATVVEVLLNDEFQAGIDWTMLGSRALGDAGGFRISSPFAGPENGFSVATVDPTGDALLGITSGDWNILANLQLLKTFGDSKVLSSPKIMAINNQTALLKVVNNLVYFTVDVNATAATANTGALTTYETEIHTVPVGFTMSVTPFVSESGDVTLNVRPTISRQIGTVNDPNPALARENIISSIPIVQEKEMSSVLRLKDKQTAIIGGLIEDLNENDRVGLPWLSDVPVIGDFFSQRGDKTRKTELVIFIRPVIIKNPDVSYGDLQHVERFLKTNPSNRVN